MRVYRKGSQTKHDLKVHLIWIPKYRKKVLVGDVAKRTRDLLRQVAMEEELTIISGKIAKDHEHMLISYRPQQDISGIVQQLKGTSSRILLQEYAHLRKQFWGRHLWGRGYLAVTAGTITEKLVADYIAEQEGEPVHDDSRFLIDDGPPKAKPTGL